MPRTENEEYLSIFPYRPDKPSGNSGTELWLRPSGGTSVHNTQERPVYSEAKYPVEKIFSPGASDIVFAAIVVCLVLLAAARSAFGNFLSNTLESAINGQVTHRMIRDRNSISAKAGVLLSIFSAASIAVFVFISSRVFSYNLWESISSPEKLFYLFALAGAAQLGKDLLLAATGHITDTYIPMQEYRFVAGAYNRILGLVLAPLSIGAEYAHPSIIDPAFFIWTGLSAAAALYTARLVRGVVISISYKFSVLFAILYLCALEIVPLLLASKIILSSL
jgi:hypothetical protein